MLMVTGAWALALPPMRRTLDNDIWLDEIWPSIILGGEPASFEEIQKLNLKVDELVEYNNSLD